METINNVPCRDPIRNLVNCSQRSDVQTVIVDGEVLLEEGKLLHVDEVRLVRDVQRATEKVWSKIQEHHHYGRTADEISPQSLKGWEKNN